MAWDEVAGRARDFEGCPGIHALVDVIDSVRDCKARERLAGVWTLNGLVVTPLPIPDKPPIQHVIVSPGWGRTGDAVLIEHRAISGHDDRILRPSTEAVPLFWRFVIEKFGIAPVRPDRLLVT
ncbi:hypothetical protein [Amycolatopsis taiwanensis]|uniref:Uncharacterized protein n=1 Tax=Amycolatopsis taiwanensis TaxID=342230 RepID=A0A9W6QV49_9PSEU|nr:hypothetical protein [Amycolatopsis taiwanensis]GLY64714.1 hypothetical protein Atai01_13330 [Amycolatopsis taiwanensis]